MTGYLGISRPPTASVTEAVTMQHVLPTRAAATEGRLLVQDVGLQVTRGCVTTWLPLRNHGSETFQTPKPKALADPEA